MGSRGRGGSSGSSGGSNSTPGHPDLPVSRGDTRGDRRNYSTLDSEGMVHASNFTISPAHRATGVSPEQAIATTHRSDEEDK